MNEPQSLKSFAQIATELSQKTGNLNEYSDKILALFDKEIANEIMQIEVYKCELLIVLKTIRFYNKIVYQNHHWLNLINKAFEGNSKVNINKIKVSIHQNS